jgi:hypothetical protein
MIRVTYSTLGNCGADPQPAVPYRWRGTPGWDPAKAGGTPGSSGGSQAGGTGQAARGAARRARFAELREAGVTVLDAGRQVGVGVAAARGYERGRKR